MIEEKRREEKNVLFSSLFTNIVIESGQCQWDKNDNRLGNNQS